MTDTLERTDATNDLFASIEAQMRDARERLVNQRSAIWDQIKELEDRAKAIAVEIARIDNFFKPPPTEPEPAKEPSKASDQSAAPKRTRAPRGTGTSIREQVLEVIRKSPKPMSPVDVIAEMNADDKTANNIRQAFNKLKEKNLIQQEKSRGPYTAVPQSETA